jgi:hypothetical protein
MALSGEKKKLLQIIKINSLVKEDLGFSKILYFLLIASLWRILKE